MRLLFVPLFLIACDGCDVRVTPQEPTPPEPPFPTADTGAVAPSPGASCSAACQHWEAQNCKEGFPVCSEFNAQGDCSRLVSCTVACERDPDVYPTAGCVSELSGAALRSCDSMRLVCAFE
jgi:hypothetical protein